MHSLRCFQSLGGCEVPSDRIFAGGRASRRQQQGYEFDHGLSFVAPAQAELKGAVEAQAELAAAGEGTTFNMLHRSNTHT